MDIGPKSIDWRQIERIEEMSEGELNELPFGAIQLDEQGRILRYNQTEAELSGRDAEAVIGKHFFEEVAPCTNVREFAGRFKEGFADQSLNAVFPYRFDFEMTPTDVWIRLFYSKSTQSAWVFVSRRHDPEG